MEQLRNHSLKVMEKFMLLKYNKGNERRWSNAHEAVFCEAVDHRLSFSNIANYYPFST